MVTKDDMNEEVVSRMDSIEMAVMVGFSSVAFPCKPPFLPVARIHCFITQMKSVRTFRLLFTFCACNSTRLSSSPIGLFETRRRSPCEP